MSRPPLAVAELVELLVDAAQVPAPPAPRPLEVDPQIDRILAMVDPVLYRRPRLPPRARPALLSRAEFEALANYSWTLPTGIWPGKRWRQDLNDTMRGRRGPPLWRLVEVFPGPSEDTCILRDRPILLRLTLDDLERELRETATAKNEAAPS